MSSHARIFKTRSSNGLKCPYCDDTKKTKFIEMVYNGMFSRWKCGVCGCEWRLDERQPIDPQLLKHDKKARQHENPYNSFSRGIDLDRVKHSNQN
ncbi:MAG: hypothetical protein WC390_09025 [Sulfurimonas sp.]|jgi:transposase-like protein